VKPYYQDDYVTLYHADCLENPELWTGADVLVTDPPYGIGYQSGRVRDRSDNPIAGDKSTDVRDKAFQMWGEKPALLFGRWNISWPSPPRHRLIWSKAPDPGMGDLRFPWGNSDEEIYVYGKGWTGTRGPNILTVPKPPVNDRPNHPTPKPVPLMELLIQKCPPGVIADPFVGSGSTLVAAKHLQRHAIGVELEERYCEITANRLSQEVLYFEGLKVES